MEKLTLPEKDLILLGLEKLEADFQKDLNKAKLTSSAGDIVEIQIMLDGIDKAKEKIIN